MKKHRQLFAVAVAAGLIVPGWSTPAAAAPTDTSDVTVTVEGGALELTVQRGSTNLGRVENDADGVSVSGQLGEVTVSDRRNAPAGSGWVVTVVASDFEAGEGSAISAGRVGYRAGSIDKQGTATYTARDPKNIARATSAVVATEVTGNNTARWTPTITLRVPAGVTAGTYAATITHSVM